MDRSPLASLCSSFRSAPGPGRSYLTDAHRTTLDGIIAGMTGGLPVQVLSGDAGIGKTTLAQQIAATCAATRRVGRVGQSNAQLLDLRRQVPRAFGLPPAPPFDDPQDGARAVAAACTDGLPALLIVDEAQGLANAGLDYLAALTEGPQPLALLLVGAPGLTARLARHAALSARVGGRYRLEAFNRAETAAYVTHRFRVAGCACHAGLQVFDNDAIGQLFALSRGVPRIVNHLVQSCLFEAGSAGRSTMDAAFVRAHLSSLVEEGRLAHLLGPPPRAPIDKAPLARPAPPLPLPPAAAPVDVPNAAPPRRSRAWIGRTGLAAALTAMLVLVPGGRRMAPSEGAIVAAGLVPLPPLPLAAEPRAALPLPTRVAIQPAPDPERLLAEALTVGRADPQRAALLYARAALWGSKRAAYYLGQIHESGDGVAPDLDRARGWYDAAADIGGAMSRLAALNGTAPPAPDPAPAAAPRPDRQMLFPQGQTELHWRSPGNAPRFRVEFVAAGGDGRVQRVDTALTAILLPQPVARWRVAALRRDGSAGPASAWSRLDPGPR